MNATEKWTDRVEFEITGHPVAKGRARSTLIPKNGGGYAAGVDGRPIIRHITPEKTRAWEADARQVARAAMAGAACMEGPITLTVEAIFAIPASWPDWKRTAAEMGAIRPTGKPDMDNVVKAAKDAANGIIWTDDSQVVDLQARKRYGRNPAVRVVAQRADGFGHHATRADIKTAQAPFMNLGVAA